VTGAMDSVRRRRIKAGLLALAVLLLLDLARAPQDQITAKLLLGSIHLYQATLSKAMPSLGVRCRFQPTCSRYAEGAIRKHGSLRGTFKAVGRIARCGPWTPTGTVDPP
jgi:putative membrane protein insertion efficiency factor